MTSRAPHSSKPSPWSGQVMRNLHQCQFVRSGDGARG